MGLLDQFLPAPGKGLLSGVLPAVYSHGDYLKRVIGGLLSDPVGSMQQTAGQIQDNDRKMEGLLTAIQDPKTRNAALPQAVDMMMAGPMGFAPMGITAWHGSPHKFSKFDSSKIGRGEGQQTEGFGLYLAEAPGVAKNYADGISHVKNMVSKDAIYEPSIYKVDLPDSAVSRMLNWDRPMSDQPPEVVAVAKALGIYDRAQRGGFAGRGIYDAVAGKNPRSYLDPKKNAKAASILADHGVPGVRYLDGMSRADGYGYSNFVVFPGMEDILTILERNGSPIP